MYERAVSQPQFPVSIVHFLTLVGLFKRVSVGIKNVDEGRKRLLFACIGIVCFKILPSELDKFYDKYFRIAASRVEDIQSFTLLKDEIFSVDETKFTEIELKMIKTFFDDNKVNEGPLETNNNIFYIKLLRLGLVFKIFYYGVKPKA